MKHFNLLLPALLLALTLQAQVTETPQGALFTSQGMKIEISYYSPSIVRVAKVPCDKTLDKKSMSVTKQPQSDIKLTRSLQGNIYTLKSEVFTVKADTATGRITFVDNQGGELFTEKDYGAQFTPIIDAGKSTCEVRQAYRLDPGEAIYGLGQQQKGRMNQRGQKVYLNNAYTVVSIPYFVSTKGYGLFWDNYSPTTFNDNPQELSLTSEVGDCIDYYVLCGGPSCDPQKVVENMRDLTGDAPMFPVWSYGFWQSKERYKTQDEVVEVLSKYRTLGVPIDGVIQDWQYWGNDTPEESPKTWNCMSFDKKRFPNPQKFVNDVHALNGHLMIVAWPGFGNETPQYKVFKEKGYIVNFNTWSPTAKAQPYDVFNPAARDLYWDYLNKGVFTYRFDGWWLDSSEPDHTNPKMPEDYDQPTYLGSFRSVHNAYPLMHTTGVYEHQRAVTQSKRVFIMTRCAFAGQQRNAADTWSGDIVANWDNFRNQIKAGLNFCTVGIPQWNTDIGGFFLWEYQKPLENDTYKELFIRWLQFGVVCPMMRVHGTDAPKEIWRFGKEGDWAYDAYKKAIELRYRLVPYIYSTSWQVTKERASFMLPLAVTFKEDSKLQNIGDEYMFGPSILAAPVAEQQYTQGHDATSKALFSTTKSRTIYLPKGCKWYDFWTGKEFTGGSPLQRLTPIDFLPLYIKEGTILPLGPKVQHIDQKDWADLEIRIYPGADAEFTLYEDEGDSYNYEKGKYTLIKFTWDDSSRTLTIGARSGSFPGMLLKRTFNVTLVSPSKGWGYEPAQGKVVTYKGKKTALKLK